MNKLKKISYSAFLFVTIGAIIYLSGPIGYVVQGGAELPEPTGAYDVGRVRLALVDQSRDEILTETPDDKREVVLSIFYPADIAPETAVSRYTEAQGLQSVDGVPAFLVRPVTPNFVDEATGVEGSFPVLLFGAGFAGPINYYTTLIEEMVSQGNIIVAVEHPYHFSEVYFPDGSVVEGNAFGLNEGIYDTEAYKEQLSAVLVEDMRFALDMAAELNQTDSRLAGRFDMARVGAFGHSFGGQTAATVALVDERVKAAVNFDGSIVDERVIKRGVTVPYLLVFDEFAPPSDEWLAENEQTVAQWWESFAERNYPASLQQSGAPFHVVQMQGATHNSFYSDLPILQPMFPFAISEEMIGELRGGESAEAMSRLTLAFFDAYLNGDGQDPSNESLAATHERFRPEFDQTGWESVVER